MTGRVFDIHRLSGHDGPGLRTVVFFKGCPLRCRWCHNPEGLESGPQVWQYADSCIGCRRCMEACSHDALLEGRGGQILLDRTRCVDCGDCVPLCPSNSLRRVDTEYGVQELMTLIEREKPFMERSDGGVTLSGGEVLLQADFAAEILKRCKDMGLHTAVDTSGQADMNRLGSLMRYADLLLYDVKLADSQLHKSLTGVDNRRILENLRHLVDFIAEGDFSTRLWIRTPLVPGQTATEENIHRIGRLLADLPGSGAVQRWELCAFNPLAEPKYGRLAMEWSYGNLPLMTVEETTSLETVAADAVGEAVPVFLTGLTARSA